MTWIWGRYLSQFRPPNPNITSWFSQFDVVTMALKVYFIQLRLLVCPVVSLVLLGSWMAFLESRAYNLGRIRVKFELQILQAVDEA